MTIKYFFFSILSGIALQALGEGFPGQCDAPCPKADEGYTKNNDLSTCTYTKSGPGIPPPVLPGANFRSHTVDWYQMLGVLTDGECVFKKIGEGSQTWSDYTTNESSSNPGPLDKSTVTTYDRSSWQLAPTLELPDNKVERTAHYKRRVGASLRKLRRGMALNYAEYESRASYKNAVAEGHVQHTLDSIEMRSALTGSLISTYPLNDKSFASKSVQNQKNPELSEKRTCESAFTASLETGQWNLSGICQNANPLPGMPAVIRAELPPLTATSRQALVAFIGAFSELTTQLATAPWSLELLDNRSLFAFFEKRVGN